jgi:DHA1 family bicyclomycin/chloramphenicol resistance-like MFS transporter
MMSRLVLVMGVAPILAPLVGGALLRLFGWRAIFLALVLVGVVSLVVVSFALPETAPPRSAGKKHGAQFVSLLRDPDFVGHALTGAFAQAAMFAYIAGSSFVFITLYGVPPERFGWFFGSNAAGLIVASQINRALLARFGPSQILRWTVLWTCSAGALVWLVASTGLGHFWGLAGSLFLLVSSLGCIVPNTTALALEHHGQRAGLASAVLGALQFTIAATASWAVSAAHDGTATPMGAVIAVAAGLSGCTLLITRWLVRRSGAGHPQGR